MVTVVKMTKTVWHVRVPEKENAPIASLSAGSFRELPGLCSELAQLVVSVTGCLCILHPPAMLIPSSLEPQHWIWEHPV